MPTTTPVRSHSDAGAVKTCKLEKALRGHRQETHTRRVRSSIRLRDCISTLHILLHIPSSTAEPFLFATAEDIAEGVTPTSPMGEASSSFGDCFKDRVSLPD